MVDRSKFLRQWSRNATWLVPGLSIKRWIGISILGLFFILTGSALLLNLKPVTFLIEMMKRLALLLPATISGPALIGAGVLLFFFGFQTTYRTLYTVMVDSGKDFNLLEALYRRNKLTRGPRIVAIGGGTGLSTLLRGLKHYTNNITAVVTVGDDGGSSGRLREEQGIIPPGDIRNCIAALADEEQLITELFQYRFSMGQGLSGHSFGNLFLTAMCRITGDMYSAVKESSKVLNIRGRVLPSTLDGMSLFAEMEDGSIVRGESHIPEVKGRIKRLFCEPECPIPLPEVIQAIEQAEVIILGPGSLYTSVVPNLLIYNIAQAISQSSVPKIYVANIMTQVGETDCYTVGDHVEAILNHAGMPNIINSVFVNSWLPDELVEKYRSAGCIPVTIDTERCAELGVEVIQKPLVDETEKSIIRHSPRRLARAIIHWLKREYRKPAGTPDNSPLFGDEEPLPGESVPEKISQKA